MLSIGEFSKITKLTIKKLRLYHEKGLLTPDWIDPETGYRYYNERSVERARVVVQLRELDFSLNDIATIVGSSEDEEDILVHLEAQRAAIAERLRNCRNVKPSLDTIIQSTKEAKRAMSDAHFNIEEKHVDPVLVAGIRTRGKYSDSSKLFGKLGRAVGRQIAGKALNLYYDGEYKEDDADFECCFPIKKEVRTDGADGVSVRELPEGRCVTLVHRGPYDAIGATYERVFKYDATNARGLTERTRHDFQGESEEVFDGGSGVC